MRQPYIPPPRTPCGPLPYIRGTAQPYQPQTYQPAYQPGIYPQTVAYSPMKMGFPPSILTPWSYSGQPSPDGSNFGQPEVEGQRKPTKEQRLYLKNVNKTHEKMVQLRKDLVGDLEEHEKKLFSIQRVRVALFIPDGLSIILYDHRSWETFRLHQPNQGNGR